MRNTLFSLITATATVFAAGALFAGDPKTVPAPPPTKEQQRATDSVAYSKLEQDAPKYSYQSTSNEVILSNGMKVTFVKLHRFSIPRGVGVVIPDEASQRFVYELAEVEMTATNLNDYEVKIENSEALFVSLKLYSKENGYKAYTSQYPLSFGSVFLKTEPIQNERMSATYKSANEFFNQSYKPGQTKTTKGIIVAVPKAVKEFDRIVVNTKEFGQNISYGCPASLK